MTRRVLDLIFGRSLRMQTAQYLEELATAPVRVSRQQASTVLNSLANTGASTVTLGATSWGQKVAIPTSELVSAHGLITGGSGAGKTRFALLTLQAIIDRLPQNQSVGFGVVDPKGELFAGAIFLLTRRLATLDSDDPDAAAELRKRIVIIDFSSTNPITPFNILAHGPNVEPGLFAAGRADLLADLLPSNDHVSVNGNAVLNKIIRLLVASNLPITRMDDVLHDDDFRAQLVRQSEDPALNGYFARQFPSVPKQTVAAISRRVEALFSSEGVRLALSGLTAPDLVTMQDQQKLVLVNCFGNNLSRSVRQLLQALILSDIRHAVFARRRTDHEFVWVLDESQAFFLNERLRDHVADLVTQSRSFGSRFHFLTQNVSTAVQDTRLLANIFTNVKWTFSMRGQPSDCTFLKSALPVTARKSKPQTNPFEPPGVYTTSEERTMEHDAIASLPDRTGYLWLRSHSAEAIKITTENLTLPSGEALQRAIAPILSDPSVGDRMSRQEYEHQIAQRDRPLTTARSDSPTSFEEVLAGTYKRVRGGRR
jgi:hypothetical protein